MKIKEINVEVSKLVAQPNYENVKYTAGVVVTVEDNEDPEVVYENALAFCKQKIGSEIVRLESK